MNIGETQRLTSFKRMFDITLGKMLQPERKSVDDVQCHYLRAANILSGKVDHDDINLMWFSPSEMEKFLVSPGDLLVLEGGDVGRSAIASEAEKGFGFQNSVHRVRPTSRGDVLFAHFWLQHLKAEGYFDRVCSKATLAHFTLDKFRETPFPIMKKECQARIAKFLSVETARIDALIEKNERLIALSGEKLRAEIDSVTQKAPGKVRVRMSKVCDYVPGKHLGVENTTTEAGDVQYLRTADLYEDMSFEKSPLWVSEPDDTELAAENDVIVCFDGFVANGKTGTLGMAVTGVNGYVGPHLAKVRVRQSQHCSDLLCLAHLGSRFAREVVRNAEGVTARSGRRGVRYFDVYLDSDLKVQEDQAANLRDKIQKTQMLKANLKRLNVLLQEKRSALITAAVTGQINIPEE